MDVFPLPLFLIAFGLLLDILACRFFQSDVVVVGDIEDGDAGWAVDALNHSCKVSVLLRATIEA